MKKPTLNYILLLSHMRGYTTLLSHIIGSNPEILGYAEKHQHYRYAFDFMLMKWKAKFLGSALYTPHFLFDKVLHNSYKVSKNVIQREDVKPLIMLRKPDETIKSIINMGQKLTKNITWYRDEQKVVNYYIKRLEKLQQYGEWAGEGAAYIQAEKLIDQTEEMLNRLTQFLTLKEKLSEEYDTFTFSGTRALGDPSEKIKQKRVIKSNKGYPHIQLDADLLATAESAYKKANETLLDHCAIM